MDVTFLETQPWYHKTEIQGGYDERAEFQFLSPNRSESLGWDERAEFQCLSPNRSESLGFGQSDKESEIQIPNHYPHSNQIPPIQIQSYPNLESVFPDKIQTRKESDTNPSTSIYPFLEPDPEIQIPVQIQTKENSNRSQIPDLSTQQSPDQKSKYPASVTVS